MIKSSKYSCLSSGFCSFGQWDKKLTQNFFNLLNNLDVALDNCIFNFECYVSKLRKVKRHLSIFSICPLFMRCGRSCDNLCKCKYCFYCWRVRMTNFDCASDFYNIDMDPNDYSQNFQNSICCLTVDVDIQLNSPFNFDDTLRISNTLCECFQVYTRPGHLCVSFSSVLVHIYINCIKLALSDLDVTLKYKKTLSLIYNYASQMLKEFWHCNVFLL